MLDKSLLHLFITGSISHVTTTDPVVTVGGLSSPTVNPGLDLGLVFNWNNGTTGKTGFYGFQRSTAKFVFMTDTTLNNGVYSGAAGTIVANLQGNVTGNADTASKLSTARTIAAMGDISWASAAFDGSANVTGVATLATTGVTAGQYNASATSITPMTFDAKGRLVSTGTAVTFTPAWSSIQNTPTTLAGYGITDGVRSVALTPPSAGITVGGSPITSSGTITLTLSNDLNAVEGLTSTGIVRRTATDTWSAGTLVSLSSEVTGNLPVTNLAAGTNASATTFWRGDASWSTAVTSVTVASANGVSATVSSQGTTPVLTIVLGAITPSTVTASGVVTAASFSGTGTALTALNASNLTSGTVATARLGSGTTDATTFLSGDQTYKTALTAVSIVSANGITGTVATATTTPAITLTLGAITPASVSSSGAISGTTIGGTTITASAGFVGSGSGLTALNASNLSSGTVPLARLGSSGTASATTFLAGDNSWKTAVTAVTLSTANGVSGTIATQGTTPAITVVLGDITPSSVVSSGVLTGTTLTATTGFSGPGSGITALNASNLTTGTVAIGRLGLSGTPSATTYLAGDNTWKTSLTGTVTSVTVTTANGISASVATQGTTPALTLTLGAITPTSVSTGAISCTTLTLPNSILNSNGGQINGSMVGYSFVGNANPASLYALIATLAASGNGTYDQITIQATVNDGWTSSNNRLLKILLSNRGTFIGRTLSCEGGSLPPGSRVQAYTQSDGTVQVYVTFVAYTYGTFSLNVIGSQMATLVASPVLSINVPPGTLVYDSSTTTPLTLTDATGQIQANSFSGSGSALTSLNASNLTTGTVAIGRLGQTGTASNTTFLRGDNAWSTAVTAVTVVSANGISAAITNQGTTPAITLTLGAITPTSINASGAINGLTLSGAGSAITALNANNLSSGTVPLAQLGTGTPSSTTFLNGANTWVTAVTAVTLTAANGISATVTNQGTTPALTLTLGDITPTSVTASANLTGAAFIPTSSTIPTTGVFSAVSGAVSISAGGIERIRIDSTGLTTFEDQVGYGITNPSSSALDCSKGNYFVFTATGMNTWTTTNVPTNVLYEFTLELTNGGIGTQTWMSNTKWSGGITPTLTSSGVDIISFHTRDGGATWRGIVLCLDSR